MAKNAVLKNILKIFLRLLLFLLLTVVTQIGGLIFLIALLTFRKTVSRKKLKRTGIFILVYLAATFLVVPQLAPLFGREQIKESQSLEAHSFFYRLANRNYVRPELNEVLNRISTGLQKRYKGIKLVYLDANFPFLNRFPLLPHLSHHDGKKIDISLIYEKQDGTLTNDKKSVSGYGAYEGPMPKEFDQIAVCKERGNWQYDFPKYLTFGSINTDLRLSEKATRDLIQIIVQEEEVGKVFIEPHLENRFRLSSSKVRYHGCQAVRHDDHIHFQLR